MSVDEALRAADRELIQIVDAAMAEAVRLAGDRLACYPGCGDCCIGPFPINLLDARRLREGVAELRKTDPERADQVVQRARETAIRFAREFPGEPVSGTFADDEEAEAGFAERFADVPCPALDPEQRRCELYTHRPVACRSFGPPVRFGEESLPPCGLCFQGASAEEIEAARVDVDPGCVEPLLLAEHGLEQTTIAHALALAPDGDGDG